MKKLLQICFIAVLVFVLFQAGAGGGAMASAQNDGVTTGKTLFITSASEDLAQVSTCWLRIRGVICVMPNVGWNS